MKLKSLSILLIWTAFLFWRSIISISSAQVPTLSIQNGFPDSTVILTISLSEAEGVKGFDFFIDLSQGEVLFTRLSDFVRNDDFYPEFRFLSHNLNTAVEIEPRKFRIAGLAPTDTSGIVEVAKFACKILETAQVCQTQVIELTGEINTESDGVKSITPTSTTFTVISEDLREPPESPTPADAGPDQVTCGRSTILEGNAPTVGMGEWSIVSGTRGRVTSTSDPNARFTGVRGQTYILRWTISNDPCPPLLDEVTVEFDNTEPSCKTVNFNNIITIPISDSGGIKSIKFRGYDNYEDLLADPQANLLDLTPAPPYAPGITSLTITARPRDDSRPPRFTLVVTDMCDNRNDCEIP